jgi:hypothetical protein
VRDQKSSMCVGCPTDHPKSAYLNFACPYTHFSATPRPGDGFLLQ